MAVVHRFILFCPVQYLISLAVPSRAFDEKFQKIVLIYSEQLRELQKGFFLIVSHKNGDLSEL